jgi:hypothetical protein
MSFLRRFTTLFLFFAIASITLLAACDLEPPGTSRDRSRSSPPGPAPVARDDRDRGRDRERDRDREAAPQFAPGQLEQHFRKHGHEMGFATQEDYLHAAQALVRGGPGVETYQRGGDTLFYRESTNEFAVLSDRNVIRTYFRPDNGRRYWERQKER